MMTQMHTDDLSLYWEDYRTHVEEGRKRTAAEIAMSIREQLWEHEMFMNL